MSKGNSRCELLGEGRTASVYLLEDGRALKLFREGWSSQDVEEIYSRSNEAERAGIPVVRSHGTMTVDDRYGILLDRVNGSSVDVLLGQSSEKERDELIAAFAKTVKQIHDTQILDPGLPDQKEYALQLVDQLSEHGFNNKEIGTIRDIIEAVPDGNGFIHGDCHTGNVFLQDGEFLFSDLGAFTGKGNRLLDICCMYSHYIFLPSLMEDNDVKRYIGMSREEGRRVYDAFIRNYYNGPSPIDDRSMAVLTAARVCLAYAYCPEIFDENIIKNATRMLWDE